MEDRALIAIMASIIYGTDPNCVTPRDAVEKANLILIEAHAATTRANR